MATSKTTPRDSRGGPKCEARTTTKGIPNGRTCTQMAGFGTDHPGFGRCRFHTGLTHVGKKVAAREAGKEYARQFYGGAIDITPEMALLEEVRRAAGIVRWLEAQIGKWNAEDGLPKMIDVGFKGSSPTDEAEWLRLFLEERKHLAKVATMAISAGIAERHVRLAEQQGDLIAVAIREILNRLGVAESHAKMLPTVVPMVLREVGEGKFALPAVP